MFKVNDLIKVKDSNSFSSFAREYYRTGRIFRVIIVTGTRFVVTPINGDDLYKNDAYTRTLSKTEFWEKL
jgi:hypothetical protein